MNINIKLYAIYRMVSFPVICDSWASCCHCSQNVERGPLLVYNN